MALKREERKFLGSFKFTILLYCLFWGSARAAAESSHLENKGKELYLSYGCALCHGWNGRGDGINSRKFDPPPTDFHDPKAYLHGPDKDSIRRSIKYGIKENNTIMPAFGDIPPEEIDQLISYLQSLQKKR
jgi:mono/diheme cytochrome c family protein